MFSVMLRVSCRLFPMPLCTPYSYELRLWMGLGNSPHLVDMSTQCKTKHMRRHRGGDSKKKRHSCTRGPRKHHTRSQARGICQQADWRTHKRGQGTRRQVQSTRTQEVHAVQAPGQGTVCVGVDIPWHNQPPEKCNPRQWWNITLTSALGG